MQPGDGPQQRGLARAVRADDRVDVAREHAQADLGERAELAVVRRSARAPPAAAPPAVPARAPAAAGRRTSAPGRRACHDPAPRPGRQGQRRRPRRTRQRRGHLGAQEHLPDRRVGQDLRGLPVGDERAARQADQPVHGSGQGAHDMLDPQHGDALGPDVAHDPDQLGHLRIGEAAGHLVQQDQPRAGGQCPGHLQPLALQQPEPLGGDVGLAAPARSAPGRRAALS